MAIPPVGPAPFEQKEIPETNNQKSKRLTEEDLKDNPYNQMKSFEAFLEKDVARDPTTQQSENPKAFKINCTIAKTHLDYLYAMKIFDLTVADYPKTLRSYILASVAKKHTNNEFFAFGYELFKITNRETARGLWKKAVTQEELKAYLAETYSLNEQALKRVLVALESLFTFVELLDLSLESIVKGSETARTDFQPLLTTGFFSLSEESVSLKDALAARLFFCATEEDSIPYEAIKEMTNFCSLMKLAEPIEVAKWNKCVKRLTPSQRAKLEKIREYYCIGMEANILSAPTRIFRTESTPVIQTESPSRDILKLYFRIWKSLFQGMFSGFEDCNKAISEDIDRSSKSRGTGTHEQTKRNLRRLIKSGENSPFFNDFNLLKMMHSNRTMTLEMYLKQMEENPGNAFLFQTFLQQFLKRALGILQGIKSSGEQITYKTKQELDNSGEGMCTMTMTPSGARKQIWKAKATHTKPLKDSERPFVMLFHERLAAVVFDVTRAIDVTTWMMHRLMSLPPIEEESTASPDTSLEAAYRLLNLSEEEISAPVAAIELVEEAEEPQEVTEEDEKIKMELVPTKVLSIEEIRHSAMIDALKGMETALQAVGTGNRQSVKFIGVFSRFVKLASQNLEHSLLKVPVDPSLEGPYKEKLREMQTHLISATQGIELFAEAVLQQRFDQLPFIVKRYVCDFHISIEQRLKGDRLISKKSDSTSHNLPLLGKESGRELSADQKKLLREHGKPLLYMRYFDFFKTYFRGREEPTSLRWLSQLSALPAKPTETLASMVQEVMTSYVQSLQIVFGADCSKEFTQQIEELTRILIDSLGQKSAKPKEIDISAAGKINKIRGQVEKIIDSCHFIQDFEDGDPSIHLKEIRTYLQFMEMGYKMRVQYTDSQLKLWHQTNLLNIDKLFKHLYTIDCLLDDHGYVQSHNLSLYLDKQRKPLSAFDRTALLELNSGIGLHYIHSRISPLSRPMRSLLDFSEREILSSGDFTVATARKVIKKEASESIVQQLDKKIEYAIDLFSKQVQITLGNYKDKNQSMADSRRRAESAPTKV